MKIGLVIFQSEESRGGAERYTVDIAEGLAARRHSVELISSSFGKPIAGVRPVEIEARAATRAGKYVQFLKNLDAHLAQSKYDLIHAMLPVKRCDIYHPHAGMAKATMQSHFSSSSGPARALAIARNRLNRKRRLYAEVEAKLIYGSDRPIVLCLSDYSKGLVLRHYPDIGEQLVKLFNGTDLARFDPGAHTAARSAMRRGLGIAEDTTVGLMIAQNFQRKGLAEVIAATASIANRSADAAPVIVVLGKDDCTRGRLQARRLGIEKRIVFAGESKVAADFYAAADFFVLPTRHDSCSLVVLEALAMGVPVISTVFNGACEAMTSGLHGYVLEDPSNVSALADAMTRLLDPQIRAKMREACLALRPSLSQEAHLDRLEEIYRERLRADLSPAPHDHPRRSRQ
jgi:UDP-glucose:(heptosyl)LPS alpha-1,3-glucosyltransferase